MASSREKEFIDFFETDKRDKGVHVIYDGQYLLLNDSTDIYKCAKSWIVLSPLPLMGGAAPRKECLLKNYIFDENDTYKPIQQQMLKANNFVIPEIAKAFGLEAASYGRFKIIDDYSGELGREENVAGMSDRKLRFRLEPRKEYLLTPSFLKNDEEFVPFGDILKSDKETNVSKIWKELEKFLIERNISKDNIKQVKKQYALKSIFGAFVELNDNHNYNDGLIFTDDRSNRAVRIAPAYDLDYSMRIYNVLSNGMPITFVKVASNGLYEVNDMLKEFKDVISEKDLAKLLSNVHPDKIAEIVEKTNKKHKLNMTNDVQYKYYDFFREKYKEMESFYQARYGKDIED